MARTLACLSPTTVPRHLRFIALPLILCAGLAGSIRGAQGSGTAAEPRPDTAGSQQLYGPPRHGMRLNAVQGPVCPAVLRDSIHVSGDKLQQYTKRYDAYMASTKATRESLRTNVQATRSAFQSGDRSAVRDRRDVVRRQSDDLAKRDHEFEKGLKDVLTKDQQTQYNDWKQRQAESNRSRWRTNISTGAQILRRNSRAGNWATFSALFRSTPKPQLSQEEKAVFGRTPHHRGVARRPLRDAALLCFRLIGVFGFA